MIDTDRLTTALQRRVEQAHKYARKGWTSPVEASFIEDVDADVRELGFDSVWEAVFYLQAQVEQMEPMTGLWLRKNMKSYRNDP